MVENKTLYLVDGSSYIYRAYHTTGGLTNSQGFPTGAIFGFANMLEKTVRDKHPSHLAVIFDARGPTFRHERYAAYKANRPPMPEDLAAQIPKIHEMVAAYNIPALSEPGFEADDIIATLVRRAVADDWNVVIVSGDKDLMQLVGDRVIMWDPQRDVEYDPVAVEAKFGVPPSRLLDLLALVGDTSDNVPGIPGVGPKTAAKLLAEYPSLEDLYERLDSLSQKKLKDKLAAHRDQAFLSRDLVRLQEEVARAPDPEDLAVQEPNEEALRSLFKEWEFVRLLDRLPGEKTLDSSNYRIVTAQEELESLIARLGEAGRFAVDLETTSQEPVRADLVGVSVCARDGDATYIPVGHTSGDQLPKEDVLAGLKPLLEDEAVEKVGQNIKYDMIVLKKEGVDINGVTCDTMLASYLLDPSRRSHSLDALAQTFLSHTMIPIKELIGIGKSQILFSHVDIPQAAKYAAEDADATLRLANILCPRVDAEGLGGLLRGLELPLVPVLRDMELAGVKVDTAYLRELSAEFGRLIDDTEAEIYDMAGERFNVNSPKQLAVILFEKLGLKPVKKTKSGPSTSLDVLEKLALEHALPHLILQYRSFFKLKSTYVDALAELVNPNTGRIHTSYNQAVAATGRLSSSDPNLQNIPIRTVEGRKIRKAFIPEEGCAFAAADYSQIELRLMAHFSGDERLREAFTAEEDIHAITAASVFNCSPALVTPEMRRQAKAINFGIIYGMGPFNLAGQLGVGLGMARKYLAEYYETYPGVKRFMDELPVRAAKDGFVTTILGRKRFLPDLNSTNKIAQQAARRMAVNTVMQGSAADLMKLAMIRVHTAIRESKLPVRLILQVHDELILEVREDAAPDAIAMLRNAMEDAYELTVPLVVESSTGANWDEVH